MDKFKVTTGNTEFIPFTVAFKMKDSYGDFYPIDEYTINTVDMGDKITRPEDPVRPGYELVDWYREESFDLVWDFENNTFAPDGSDESTPAAMYLYARFDPLTSGKCGENASWAISDEGKTLKITGSGALYDFTEDTAPWIAYRDTITKLDIASGITDLGDYCFYNCKGITKLILPYGITSIGKNTFAGCSGLTRIAIPSGSLSANAIDKDAFLNCDLDKLTLVGKKESLVSTFAKENLDSGLGKIKNFEAFSVIFKEKVSDEIKTVDELTIDNVDLYEKITKPTADFREGMEIAGVYRDSNFKNQWNFDEDTFMPDSDDSASMTLYVKWIRRNGDYDWGDILEEDRALFDMENLKPDTITVAGVKDSVTYTGSKITFDLRVYRGTVLLNLKHYSVKYANNTNVADKSDEKAPSVKVVLYDKSESDPIKFSIVKADISESGVYAYNITKYATGKYIKITPKIYKNGKTFSKKCYTIEYDEDHKDGKYKDTGSYVINIVGTGNYTGSIPVKLTLVDKSQAILMSSVTVKGLTKSIACTGQPVTQSGYKLSVKKNGVTSELVEGKDFTVEYRDNIKAGSAYIIFKAIEGSAYAGQKEVKFIIKSYTIKGALYTNDKYKTKLKTITYTGSKIEPEHIYLYTPNYNGKKPYVLKKGVDYDVEYTNSINAGTATVNIIGKGAFLGKTGKLSYSISQVNMTKSTSDFTVDIVSGSVVKNSKKAYEPKVNVIYKDKLLIEGADYTLSYTNNKKVAAADDAKAPTIKIKGRGNFTGYLYQKFTIAE